MIASSSLRRTARLAALLLALAWMLTGGLPASAEETQKVFKTPDLAAEALIQAVDANDLKALAVILGPGSEQVLASGDPVADKNGRQRFMTLARQRCRLVVVNSGWAALVLGTEKWSFPIPIVRKGKAWCYDTAAGKEELLNRRIGTNELVVLDVLHQVVDAQFEYASKNRTGGGKQFATRIRSSKGKKDGLYWDVAKGEAPSPLGPFMARAEGAGYRAHETRRVPYFGYYYRILTGQGPHARGGERSYMVGDRMVNGFAVVAWPASYKSSGVMTFLVNQHGIIYQKNLGPKTESLVNEMTVFDPDDTWTVTP